MRRFSFDEYLWAMGAVLSRQNVLPIGGKSVLALIPLWDMLNHSEGNVCCVTRIVDGCDMLLRIVHQPISVTATHATYFNTRSKITSFFVPSKNALDCTSLRDYKAGEQVYMSYGSRPTSELLLFQGFVPSSNAEDSVDVFPSYVFDCLKCCISYLTLLLLLLLLDSVPESDPLYSEKKEYLDAQLKGGYEVVLQHQPIRLY
jgi:hypothetical protein